MKKENMNENKKVEQDLTKEKNNQELNLDELEDVTGGSIKNVPFTPTYDITEDIRKRI